MRSTSFHKLLRSILLAGLAMSLSAGVALAVHELGLFELDGNAIKNTATDWQNVYNGTSGALATAFVSSATEAPATDTSYYTGGGSKDVNDINQWQFTTTDVAPDKDQITNAYAAAYSQNNNLYLYFGADRFANDGDAQIGFWFFKNKITLNPANASGEGTFNGAHAVGDLLILSDFTQGGRISTIKVYKWVGSGGSDGPLNLLGNGFDCSTSPAGDGACALVNSAPTGSPWPFTPKSGSAGTFPTGSFFEGGINVTQLLGQSTGCFSTFLAETRSSQSPTAQLKDLAMGAFDLCAARISITPPTATNEINSNHTFTIKVEKKDSSTGYGYALAANVLVTASLTNANGANSAFVGANTCTTNASGTCTVTIKSTAPGSTTVSASANVSVGNEARTVSTDGQAGSSGPANKLWVDARILIAPNGVNEIGKPHTFTVSVLKNAGDGAGYVAATNQAVLVTLTNSNGANAVVSANSCNSTDGNGKCSVTFASSTAGIVKGHASASIIVGGLTLARETNGANGNSGDAVKTYVDAKISIRDSATNEVGKPHTFTVKVEKNEGAGFIAASGVKPVVTFSAPPSSVNSASCAAGTNASGECTVTINSNAPGVFSAHAAADVSAAGLTLHRETNGQAGNSTDAVKTYVDARIIITPNGVNEVGKPHTFVVTTLKNTGAGFVPASGVAVLVTLNNANGANNSVSSNTCASTDLNGQCAVTFVSATPGIVTGHASASINVNGLALARETNGQNGNSGDAVKTYVDARISIDGTATNEVGKPHTFTVTVLKNDGGGSYSAASGVAVQVNLSNANGANAVTSSNTCASTDANGKCAITFASNTAGVVTGHASADVSVGGLSLHRETNGANGNSRDAVKTYVDARISITPNATNEVGAPHTFTVKVEKNEGSGFVAAPGVKPTVTFNAPPASVDASSCNTGTGTSGTCTVTINSAVAGVFTAHASADILSGGLTLHRETNGQSGNSGDAVKTYVDARISIDGTATNEVGKPHTFTVTVLKDAGAGFIPAAGVAVQVNLSNASGASAVISSNTCSSTDANGKCAVTFTSNTAGVITGHAVADVSVGGLTLHRETNGANGNSRDAVKTYVDAKISIAPSATNGIEEFHIFTVHIEKNPGTGFVPAAGVVATVTFATGTPAIFDPSDCADGTDANGNCQVIINSNVAGVFTAHAAADVSVGGLSLHRETNGQSGNSSDATKTYVAGSLKWFKVDGAGKPLGGATFQVCRTANYVSASNTFQVLPSPVCFSVSDNNAPDADATAGTFLVNGIVLGKYTVTETAAPAGYAGDTKVASVDLTIANRNGVVSEPFVNRAVLAGKIAPTQTTCQDFANGTAADLNELFYGVKSNKIGNVAPGVFFYFTKLTAPSANFTIQIQQSNNNGAVPLFAVQRNSQVTLYNADCTSSNLGKLTVSGGQATLNITGATAGKVYIVSVKYDSGSVVGVAAPNPTTVHYDYATLVNGSPVDKDSNGLDLKKK
ncbi:MAG: prealbumin-like fold domain-containing protein [Chloroflexi bacterium]|nr:prealbumin-like fold domain-containing protein [Chloroflexota bacterium]